jgi:hypothetical protein
MKLNEVKRPQKLDELDLAHVIGDYGAAGAKQIGNRLFGNKALGQLSVNDRMTKDIFLRDFTGNATSALLSAIESGLVDPNAKAGATPQPPTQAKAPAVPLTPAQVRQQKQAAATQTAQANMAGNPVQAKSGQPVQPQQAELTQTPQTPAQIRQQKQAAAAQAAQAGMTPKAVAPVAQTPAQIRQQKQAAAAQAAQAGMTAKPAAPVAPKARGGKVPGQLSMTPNAVRKRNARSIAADRNRLIGDTGNVNESIYNKLNYLFEGLMNLDEATMTQTVAPGGKVVGQSNKQQQAAAAPAKRSISNYLQSWFKKYTLIDQMAPDAQKQAIDLMNKVEATWGQDHGKAALAQLGNLAFTLKQSAEEQPAQAAATGAAGTASQNANQTGQKLLSYLQLKGMVNKLRKRDRLSLLRYLEKTVKNPTTQVSTNDEPMATKEPEAAPKLTPGKGDIPFPRGKAGKIGPARAGGPTPDEQANLERRIQQAVNRK